MIDICSATPARQSSRGHGSATVGSIQIAPHVLVSVDTDQRGDVRTIPIDTLEEESRRINTSSTPHPRGAITVPDSADSTADSKELSHFIVDRLLNTKQWQPPAENSVFFLSREDILDLCDAVMKLFQTEPSVLNLRAPIKVYGDIHGQFPDLLRLFDRYKSPSEAAGGDIDAMDYLFLGDFVDRGSYSLETICLLFALKVKYPTQIHLIRGNHEDQMINAVYGFRDECKRRLREDPEAPNSCWLSFNKTFEWLPMGAQIEGKILCIHGGIGGSVQSVDDIRKCERPLKVAQIPQTDYEQKITDLLWSDPTDNDSLEGVTVNETRDPDGSGKIVKFGPDRVNQFLVDNNLSMIIRAHECVMDGFERFASGKLITLFSATDYCGHHKNAGALLFIRRDMVIVPKIIYPDTRVSATWDPTVTQQRPPTPPRPRMRSQDLNGFSVGS
eukprot:GHVL01034255.1.p1 GENE.GHVL01034255.1~~GHVL01034255.1.p1  ORF type:complete len:444 (+),score=56.94 GHVL01034255.1:1419-2750(+)